MNISGIYVVVLLRSHMSKSEVLKKPNPADEQTFSTEVIFETLSSRRRRFTLHYLTQVGTSVTIRELSEQIAAWENGVECHMVTPKQRKRVYTALHQTHLPKMNRLGIIVYDANRKTITLSKYIQDFDIYLDIVSPNELPWSRFYLLLGFVFFTLVIVAAQGIQPFSYLDGFGYALVGGGVLIATSCVHFISERRTQIGGTATPPDVEPPREITE